MYRTCYSASRGGCNSAKHNCKRGDDVIRKIHGGGFVVAIFTLLLLSLVKGLFETLLVRPVLCEPKYTLPWLGICTGWGIFFAACGYVVVYLDWFMDVLSGPLIRRVKLPGVGDSR